MCVYPIENPRFKGEKWNDLYLDKPIESLDDWIELFSDPNNYIENEYGERITKEEMIDIIAHRKPQGEVLEGWHKLGEGTEFESRVEYFFIKGLMVHKLTKPEPSWLDVSRYEEFNKVMPSDCTYDLILSGNDTESGEIFC